MIRTVVGWVTFAAGSWMLVSPQALIGLEQLRWMHRYSFPGEVLLGIALFGVAYSLLDLRPTWPRS